MNFSDVLDLHNSYSPKESHSDIIGDGFLMETNPIYRKIKIFSKKIGCEFVEAYSEYLLLPFHELPNIVANKKIPFVPSARLMRRVEERNPGVFSTQDISIPESYHLHEAAHVVAEHFLKDIPLKNRQEEILKSLMAESFANTVDALICNQAVDEIHHFFIKQNCYMHPQKKIIKAMGRLKESMGFRFVFMLTFFTYLHANFLAKPPGKKIIHELAQKYGGCEHTDSEMDKDILAVRGIGEKLDPLFRVVTSGNYFKGQGFEEDIHELLDFSFLKVFYANPRFREVTEALCAILE